jgi:hypothetical protein
MVNHEFMALSHSKSMYWFWMFKSEDADFHFCRQSDAIRAIQSMDGQLINGRSMQISQSTAHYVYMCFMLFF